jgi:hypothetical protein
VTRVECLFVQQVAESLHTKLESELTAMKAECASLRQQALDAKQGVTAALKDRLQAVQEKNKLTQELTAAKARLITAHSQAAAGDGSAYFSLAISSLRSFALRVELASSCLVFFFQRQVFYSCRALQQTFARVGQCVPMASHAHTKGQICTHSITLCIDLLVSIRVSPFSHIAHCGYWCVFLSLVHRHWCVTDGQGVRGGERER